MGILGLLADAPAISLVAVGKSPWMLIKGWQRLVQDSVGRHGPCLDAACVPFAGLAIVFWPLVVAVSVLCAIICSPFFGLFGAVVVYQVCNFSSTSFNLAKHLVEFLLTDCIFSASGMCWFGPLWTSVICTRP